MPWSGATFTRTNGVHTGATLWADDEAAGTGIESSRQDTHDQDIATGLNACLRKDGGNSPSADLPMNAHKLTALSNGSARTDSIPLGQVQDGAIFFLGNTSGAANAQTGSLTPAITGYAEGQTFVFLAGYSNTAACTLNINGVGAKPIYKAGLESQLIELGAGDILAYGAYRVTYTSAFSGCFVLHGEKPTTKTWTPNITPAAGVYTIFQSHYLYSRSGQTCSIFMSAYGVQSLATNNYTFTLPVNMAPACASPGIYLATAVLTGVTVKPALISMSSTSVLVVSAADGTAFPGSGTNTGFSVYLTYPTA